MRRKRVHKMEKLIEKLEDIVDGMNGGTKDGEYFTADQAAEKLVELAHKNGMEELADEIIHTDDLDELVNRESEGSWGWVRAKYLLGQIDWLYSEYYRLDAYGNARNLTCHDLEVIAGCMTDEAKDRLAQEAKARKAEKAAAVCARGAGHGNK